MMETNACPEMVVLSSFLDDEIEDKEDIRLHLQNCPACTDRIKRFQAADRLMKSHRSQPGTFGERPRTRSCISPEDMTAYFHDLLGVDEERTIDEHLDSCDACLIELSSLSRNEALLKRSKTEPLPGALKGRVEGLWKGEARSHEPLIRVAIRLVKGGMELIRESLFPEAISFQEVFAPVGAYRGAESKESLPTGVLLRTTLTGVRVSLLIQRQTDNQARLEVKIEDEELRPVAAQRVSVRRERALLVSERTTGDGTVTLANLEPGTYQVGVNILGKEHHINLEINGV